MSKLTRRKFLHSAAAGALVAAGSTWSWTLRHRARAAESLLGVDWGKPYIDADKVLAEQWGKADFTWDLHAGGAQTVLPKIKSSWPNTPYDFIDAWDPVFITMIREGWAATIPPDRVTNLADVPEGLIAKDDQGNWKSVPRSLTGQFFVYRSDTVPFEITNIEDLLDPRLKGQILWPSPVLNTNIQVTALAMQRGGDLYNLEPGWEFLKELAKSGNIGRVAFTITDLFNSLTTGETSVAFIDQGSVSTAAKNVPIVYLTKTDPSLKSFLATEGWVALESSKKKDLVFDFFNFCISAEKCEQFNKAIGNTPTNSKSKVDPSVRHLVFTNEELKKFAVLPDWDHQSKIADEGVKRFEKDIVPLL